MLGLEEPGDQQTGGVVLLAGCGTRYVHEPYDVQLFVVGRCLHCGATLQRTCPRAVVLIASIAPSHEADCQRFTEPGDGRWGSKGSLSRASGVVA